MDNKLPVFSVSFINTFNSLLKTIDESLDLLNDAPKKLSVDNYGLCNKSYKVRFITPNNVASFIDKMTKLQHTKACKNIDDYNLIMTALVKQLIEENGSVPFGNNGNVYIGDRFISSKSCTLKDLILSWENEELCETKVLSSIEMKQRVTSAPFVETLKTLNDMIFVATMKNIVSELPKILKDSGIYRNAAMCDMIEEFILFTCTIFLMSISEMLSYAYPSTAYKMNEEKHVMECALLKTNSMCIKSRLPFNINMKNVVLTDTSNGFKDTANALKFITTDSRSPISVLLMRYNNDINRDIGMNTIPPNILSIFGDPDNPFDHNYTIEAKRGMGFKDNVSWLDTIVNGDPYLDGNYRTDANGNNHVVSVMNTLNTIYKLYGYNESASNIELTKHIYLIEGIMNNLISILNNRMTSSNKNCNIELFRDVLAVFGEILTRSMLKLYSNNTKIVDCSKHMEDSHSPSYLYAESFIMEADDPQSIGGDNKQPQPTVSAVGTNTTNTNTGNVSKLGEIKKNIANIVAKFIDWVRTQVATFAARFNKNHERELKWITQNMNLNREIGEALANKSFMINVNALPDFKIPANELLDIKVNEVVNKWLNSKDPIDPVTVKKELYPGGEAIASQIANAKTPAEEAALLTNYILYSKTKPNNPYSGQLSSEQWNDLVSDLSSTNRLIESQTKKISDELRKACEMLQTKIRNANVTSVTNKPTGDNQPDPNAGVNDRASQLFSIIQGISASYYVTILNTIRSKFYTVNYKLYQSIIKIYNQQKAKNPTPNTTNNTNTQTNTNPNNTQSQTQNSEMPEMPTT